MAEKAVLLSFRIQDNQVIDGTESRYFDKVPMKFADYDQARFEKKASELFLLPLFVKALISLKIAY